MYFGKMNREKEYSMVICFGRKPHIIEKALTGKNLGLIISNDVKWVNRFEKATSSAKLIIAQIGNILCYFVAVLVKLLYVHY